MNYSLYTHFLPSTLLTNNVANCISLSLLTALITSILCMYVKWSSILSGSTWFSAWSCSHRVRHWVSRPSRGILGNLWESHINLVFCVWLCCRIHYTTCILSIKLKRSSYNPIFLYWFEQYKYPMVPFCTRDYNWKVNITDQTCPGTIHNAWPGSANGDKRHRASNQKASWSSRIGCHWAAWSLRPSWWRSRERAKWGIRVRRVLLAPRNLQPMEKICNFWLQLLSNIVGKL